MYIKKQFRKVNTQFIRRVEIVYISKDSLSESSEKISSSSLM